MSLRLISFLILLGTMPLSSVYAQCDSHSYNENGFCQTEGCTSPYQEPTKDENGVYQIANAGNLYWFANHVNSSTEKNNTLAANAKLTADITVNENVLVDGELNSDVSGFRQWTPIGNSSNDNKYNGSFDGQGYTISGLYYSESNNDVGLFGYTYDYSINNLGVIDSYFNANENVGGIVGYADSFTSITNCYSISNISGNDVVGGIAGLLSNFVGQRGSVTNCYNAGLISGNTDTGAIVGYNTGSVTNCYNAGLISGDTKTGAIVGYNEGSVTNCYNAGDVSGTNTDIGGIVGLNYEGTVSNCYNAGDVSGTNTGIGGIVGLNYEGTVSNCYYLSGKATGGINGTDVENQAVAKTSTQFSSGEVAYLLQDGVTAPSEGEAVPQVWGQNIDNGQEKQDYPVFSDAKVSQGICGTNIAYTNVPGEGHAYVNGFCACSENVYQPAVLNNNGTENDSNDDYYEIANAGNLYWFADYVNDGNSSANAKLMNDIVVNTNVLNENGEPNTGSFRQWTPIGIYSYTGTFHGVGHTISGLYCESTSNVGLFSYADECIIQDLGVIDSYFNAENYVGGIVGRVSINSTISITNCYSISKISGKDHIGGIAGSLTSGSTVSNCYNEGSISGSENFVGGIAGYNAGTVSDSYNAGSVLSSYWVGGIAGVNAGTVSNCYNEASIRGSYNMGGIAGNNSGSVLNCYNEASISGDSDNVGGIAGYNTNKGSVSNCYNSGFIAGTSVGGIAGGNQVYGGTNVSNCYYLEGTAPKGIGDTEQNHENQPDSKTTDEFASGEVAYLLQNAQNSQDPIVWGQNIDNDASVQNRQYYPVLGGAKVYQVKDGLYTNNNISENVFWSYEDNTLTIYGSGVMRDFTDGETKPWSNYLSEINTVVVKAGITRIGSYAFKDLSAETEIIIYGTTRPSFGENWYNDEYYNDPNVNQNVYIPNIGWNVIGWNVRAQLMPAYTKLDNGEIGWKGLNGSTPSLSDHVAINANMTISSNASLSVKSFGYCSDDVRITVEDGGQLTCSLANGEVTVQKSITGDASTPGWYTISSPLEGSVEATSVTNLIDVTTPANYALYRYDEPSFTWQNYKYKANNFTTLDAGRGYLYARSNSEVTTLKFKGDINTKPVQYALTVDGDALQGFHLVGNPFTHNITISQFSTGTSNTLVTGYYVLSNQGAWAADPSTDGDIKPGQGILIKTTAAGTLTINPTQQAAKGQQPRANSQQPMLSLNVSNGNYSDRAFVIFGKGIGLDKINHQNEDIPVLYIPMSDADYAIAMMDESVNEIPVGFESSSMGEFTISLRQENCEFEELYLLDKETGAKVNILEQDYTFMATSGDNAERFTLIMAQGSQPEAQSNFAYISNNDIVIYDVEGNAHIDIYDVLGRRVYNTTGRDDVHIVSTDGYSAGVYVIRIMDENGLRTQKVVIE